MAPLWNDPDPTFDAMATACERMQIPELEIIPNRGLVQIVPPLEATNSYWRTPMRSFSKFPELKPELRKIVWEYTIINDARVIEMRHPDLQIILSNETPFTEPAKLIKPRALLSVCTESRDQLLKSLREVNLGTLDFYLVNLEVDIIYFGPDSHWFHEVLWRPAPPNAQEVTDYNSTDRPKKGWQKRQKWNHWRSGYEKGTEAAYDEYQNRDQTRRCGDNFHPLLSSENCEDERNQIQNVAFDLEFWKETFIRRCGGQRDLLCRFPSAKTFFLAAGDIGSADYIERHYCSPISGVPDEAGKEPLDDSVEFDDGQPKDEVVVGSHDSSIMPYRIEIYRPKIVSHRTKSPGVIHKVVELRPGAVQISLSEEVKEITMSYGYPKPVTMFVTRDGKFEGDESRYITLRPRSRRPDDDDNSDTSYDDEELLSDSEEQPGDLTRIPRLQELLGLYDDLEDITEEELHKLKCNLPDSRNDSVDEMTWNFHEEAAVPEDEDTEDEMMEIDEQKEDTDHVNVAEAVENVADTMTIQDNDEQAQSRDAGTSMPFVDNSTANAKKKVQTINKCGKFRTSCKIKKRPSAKTSTSEKENNHTTTATKGYEVAEITESRVHYGNLKYRVRFHNQTLPNKHRYSRTEAMFVDNEHCKALIVAWHKANPEADDLQTEANYQRKAYGSGTDHGKKSPVRPTSSPDPSTSISNLSAPQARSHSNQTYMMSDTLVTLPSILEPSSSLSSLQALNELNDEMTGGDSIEVDSSSSATLSSALPSACSSSPSSVEQLGTSPEDWMRIDE